MATQIEFIPNQHATEAVTAHVHLDDDGPVAATATRSP